MRCGSSKPILTIWSLSLDLLEHLPVAVPLAVKWASEQEGIIVQTGSTLTETGKQIARAVGVRFPESVRVVLVERIPEPDDPKLFQLAKMVEMISSSTAGITFGYGIYIRRNCAGDLELMAHELTHVGQYERLGGALPFMLQYCRELATVGYKNSPLED